MVLGLGQPTWQRLRDVKLAERNEKLSAASTLLAASYASAVPTALPPKTDGGDSPASSVATLTLPPGPPPFPSAPVAESILVSDASGIVRGIKERRWTASEVLLVFMRRSLEVNAFTNAITEVLFEEAVKRARELDEEFGRTGEVVGLLHGVPVSLKDQYNVVGFDSAIGFTHGVGQPATEDAALVIAVREAGGVPFCKTNVPQTMLSFECANPLGVTKNPHSAERTPGGSTGGEAALLGADGSALGFGSDIGGSLRIPAAYSGCFGLKPCHGRVMDEGARSANPGFEAIRGSLGPMGRSVDDLEVAMRVLLDASAKLYRTLPLVPIPFREVTLPAKLKVGYYLTDGFVRASPACRRAVLETVDALRKRGHECIEFAPPSPMEGMELFVALTSAGGYQTLLAGLLGDPQESAMFLAMIGPKLPWPVRVVVSFLLRRVVGDEKFATLFDASCHKSVTEMQHWQLRKAAYVSKFREEVWGKMGLDAILCSTQAVPALKVGETWNLSPLAIGTILYNVVESAAGVVPVTFVDPVKDAVSATFLQEGPPGSKVVEATVYGGKGRKGVYDSVEMAGLPVGVQVVGAAFEEEKVIAMMREVDAALGPRGFSPGDFTKRTAKRPT